MISTQAETPIKIAGPDGKITYHTFAARDILAVNAALSTGRPLLLQGEPGTGKSQLAYAAASELGRSVVAEVVTANTTLDDMLWRMDAVGRLSEAQVLAPGECTDKLAAENFLQPGALWRAFDPASTAGNDENARKAAEKQAEAGAVLLLDEIDKADPRLPNGLLAPLGNLSFEVPLLKRRISPVGTPPLIVITTNQDRRLPAPFLRRCLVHTLSYPDDANEKHFNQWLVSRAQAHWVALGESIDDPALLNAAEMIRKDRLHDREIKPGFAEYLDLLAAYAGLRGQDNRAELLDELSAFVLEKQED